MSLRPEGLTASDFFRKSTIGKKAQSSRNWLHQAAQELQDDFITHLPRTSFDAVPDEDMMINGFSSGAAMDEDHPFGGYRFALMALTSETLKQKYQQSTANRELLQVDPALPTVSSEHCEETKVWNVSYHTSSLFKSLDGGIVPTYGVLSILDQEQVANLLKKAIVEASLEDVLAMLNSPSKRPEVSTSTAVVKPSHLSKSSRPSNPHKPNRPSQSSKPNIPSKSSDPIRPSKSSKSSKPKSLLESLRISHQDALRDITLHTGYIRDLWKCRTALGKQAGTTELASHMVHLHNDIKVQISTKMSPHIGFFHSQWLGIGKAMVSKLQSGAICYSTSTHVARVFQDKDGYDIQIPGTESIFSHEFCEGIATELARRYRSNPKSKVDDATALMLASTQQKYIKNRYHTREQANPTSEEDQTPDTLELAFQDKGEPDFVVSFDPHPGMPAPLATRRIKAAHHKLAKIDHSLQKKAAKEGQRPCYAVPSAFAGGSHEDRGVPDYLMWPGGNV